MENKKRIHSIDAATAGQTGERERFISTQNKSHFNFENRVAKPKKKEPARARELKKETKVGKKGAVWFWRLGIV